MPDIDMIYANVRWWACWSLNPRAGKSWEMRLSILAESFKAWGL